MTDDPDVEPIAIIGLACRLPGARDAGQFWQNLVNGVESIKTTTLAEQAAFGVPESMLSDPAFVPAAAYLDDYEYFDAAYFGMSPREAELRDPQHRLLLELAHTTLEDAGYDATRYRGDIGVYVGCGDASYEWRNVRRNRRIFNGAGELAVAVNTHPAFLSTFLSYQLDLRGPSLSVGTACSTALVTLHLACEALRAGECDMALTGAASVDLPLGWGYVYAEGGVHSSDGHIRTFDAAAEGTIWGNGGGMVLLKPLSAALRDGDHVRAVVLGNAINNDGADRAGYTSPSQQGQTAVIAQALGVAGVDPTTITYVEAHGTGTELGDPIELAALGAAYRRDPAPDGEAWCAIGSVKPNIGHLGRRPASPA
ncbi:polyketide synthase [Phytohabitans flavus]|uniref:beta-ketoacyl [acyl carrier protein] synthase domain-containing protein n=1 Tax=Phytohabitans flavus TaxID=1076124 RepID=UPI003631DF63